MRETRENPEHDDEHRHLGNERQARRQRVHLVRLVQTHHFFVELLSIATVLELQTAQFGLQTLHLQHPFRAFQGERREDDHDENRHEADRRRVVTAPAVHPVDHSGDDLKHDDAPCCADALTTRRVREPDRNQTARRDGNGSIGAR